MQDSGTTAPERRPRRELVGQAAEASVVMAGLGALALSVTALLTFLWGFAKVWTFVDLLLDEGADSTLAIVRLLEIIDLYLLGAVLLILALGLVELFVTPLRLPTWLVIEDLGDLKGKLIDVIQIVAAIKFLEKLAVSSDPLDILWYALAVSAVILALLAVRWVHKSTSG